MAVYNRERYNASRRPSYSADDLRAEFDRVQRGIHRPQEIDLRDFGSVGGGNDDTVALAKWARAVQETGDGYIPKGTFIHDGTLTLAPTRATKEVRVRFDPEAWLAPTAGWGLKLDGAFNTTLERPRVKLIGSSTATRGIWVIDSRWPKLYQPTVWSFIEIPANFVGIDVDDNSYWTEIQYPQIRKDSGSITSNFAKGIRFTEVSNACTVWGGSINHCDDGVYVDGVNAIRVIATAFEDCTDGVEFAEGDGGVNGGVVVGCRFEEVTNDVNMSWTTAIANAGPIQVYGTVYSTNGTILNPNSQKFYEIVRGGVRLRAATGIDWATNDVTTSLGARVRESGGSITVEANGNVVLNGDMDASGAGDVRINVGGALQAQITGTLATFQDPVLADHFIGTVVSPAQITGNRNDYTGLGTAETARLSTDASRNITGFAGGVDGRNARIINVGAFDIVLQNENAGSAAANRILTGTGADVTLAADDTAQLWYDGTTARWRIVGNY